MIPGSDFAPMGTLLDYSNLIVAPAILNENIVKASVQSVIIAVINSSEGTDALTDAIAGLVPAP